MRRHAISAMVATAGLVTTVAACNGGATDRTGGATAKHPVVLHVADAISAEELQPFIDQVARLSKGSISLDVKAHWHGTSLTGEIELVQALQAGQVDLGVVPVRAWPSVGVHSFDALNAPFAVDSVALERAVVSDSIAEEMLAGVRPLGLTGLAILPGPVRHPIGVSHLLVAPADYRASTIGINPSSVAAQTFSALSATATPELFQGRPVDQLDGFEQQVSSVSGNRYDTDPRERPRTLTSNVSLWTRPFTIVANTKAFSRLTPEQRRVLEKASASAVATTAVHTLVSEKDSVDQLCRRGLLHFARATAGDLEKLRLATAAVVTALRDDAVTAHVLDRAQQLRIQDAAAIRAEPEPRCGQATTVTPGHATSQPLDGTYVWTTTAQDLLAIGTPSQDVQENFGNNVVIVSRGRFAASGRNGTTCGYAYGRFEVKGRRFTMFYSDGFSNNGQGANQPDELFTYGWSLFHETLTLSAVPGALSPEPSRAKPWLRVSTKPLFDKLDTECRPPKSALNPSGP